MNIPERLLEPREPEMLGKCAHCGEGFYKFEEAVCLEDEWYHLHCFKDIAVTLLFQQYGAMIRMAGEQDE